MAELFLRRWLISVITITNSFDKARAGKTTRTESYCSWNSQHQPSNRSNGGWKRGDHDIRWPHKMILMAHAHCTGQGQRQGLGTMGFCITLCTVPTTQVQGQGQGTIVFYCAHPNPCPCPGASPTQCVWTITLLYTIYGPAPASTL